MKIVIDMNLSPLWVQFLASHGITAIHWSTIGKPSAPDSEILEYAALNGFLVFTHDLDFGMLLVKRKSHGPSVLQVRTQDILPSAIGTAVLRALNAAHSHLEAGALVTVDLARHRIRMLPIGLPSTAKSQAQRQTPLHGGAAQLAQGVGGDPTGRP